MWMIKPSLPPPSLASVIQYYWIGHVPHGETIPTVFLPSTGCSSMLISFGKKHLKLRTFGERIVQTHKVVVMGQYYNNLEVIIPDDLDIIGILFRPTALNRFCGFNMDTLTHNILPGEDVFGNSVLQLSDRIAEADAEARRLRLVDDYFLKLFKHPNNVGPLVQEALHYIAAKKGNVQVSALADYFHVSGRLLEKRFREQVGISPKYMSKVVKFNTMLGILKSRPNIRWAELAYLAGYYDQSHMISAFIEFTGRTPVQYEGNDNEMTEFYLNA
ncbi:helix-turn-helix domain-containing protein [Chryseolinea lacunae]|uniref:AraC family transcriptional regulator n=1 Tax=Chryseolinea lacunae TaxID=2801331 RepID=A0ABS1KYJ2_9BACT|nr:helix-turn-helix domain-containing protein [Chryseolinea lacunae]MBL0744521.1 AraC family transcriptional regulator [Chryseolinea lacunae]